MLGKVVDSSAVRGLSFKYIVLLLLHASCIAANTPKEVAPYLLPENHPAKSAIDNLFQSDRVTFNLESLKKAGFKDAKPREFTKIVVTSHPDIPGYIFKLYLDVQRYHKNKPEQEYWILRVKGARKVHKEIYAHHLQKKFKVPKKWIYELPSQHQSGKGYYPKNYILVEEDMQILSKKENYKCWHSDVVTKELLKDLALILQNVGLYDAKPDNFPFCKDGRIAFVDTQTYGVKEINSKKLLPYLNRKNRFYWEELLHIKRD